MNNKYSVACITRSWQIQNKYRWNGLNIRWYIRPIRFENSIRTQKNDSQVPNDDVCTINTCYEWRLLTLTGSGVTLSATWWQEVDYEHYTTRLRVSMKQLGYEGVLLQRRDDLNLATFWHSSRFQLVAERHSVLHELVEAHLQVRTVWSHQTRNSEWWLMRICVK